MIWLGAAEFAVTLRTEVHGKRLLSREDIVALPQPEPFTPGLTKRMVLEHALRLNGRESVEQWPFARADWILVEQHLLEELQNADY